MNSYYSLAHSHTLQCTFYTYQQVRTVTSHPQPLELLPLPLPLPIHLNNLRHCKQTKKKREKCIINIRNGHKNYWHKTTLPMMKGITIILILVYDWSFRQPKTLCWAPTDKTWYIIVALTVLTRRNFKAWQGDFNVSNVRWILPTCLHTDSKHYIVKAYRVD